MKVNQIADIMNTVFPEVTGGCPEEEPHPCGSRLRG